MDEKDPNTGKHLQTLIAHKSMPIANPDILSSDGERVFMQEQNFDMTGKRLIIAPGNSNPRKGVRDAPDTPAPAQGRPHLFCQTGFLDDVWFHRSFWTYASDCGEGWGFYMKPRKSNPCGRIMAFDESRVYGFVSDPLHNMLHPRQTYKLYATSRNPAERKSPPPSKTHSITGLWEVKSPSVLVNAMAIAGNNLFVAGVPDLADETKMLGYLPGADDDINRELIAQEAAWLGKHGGLLHVVSVEEGRKLAEYKLDHVPRFDGMSVAEGKLFISMKNGAVVCFKEE
jgi:hypothetical protein